MTVGQPTKRPLERNTAEIEVTIETTAGVRVADAVWPTALEFAELIAGYHRKVHLHTGGNEYEESIEWPVEEPDRPWTVRLTDRTGCFATLAFDFDAKLGDPVGDAERFSAVLTTLGIAHVLVRSGPTDGRHVLIRVEPRVPPAMARALAETVKADYTSLDKSPLVSGTGAAIRPPFSPHREGDRSEVLGDPHAALETLRRPNDPRKLLRLLGQAGKPTLRHRVELTATPSPGSVEARVSPTTLTLLLTGEKASGDRSPSGVLWSVLVGLANAGFTFEEAARTLTNPRYRISEVIASRARDKHRELVDYLDHEWEKASQWVQLHAPVNGPNDARIEVHKISEAASRATWSGRTGSTDHAVLEALIAIALKIGRLEFTASHRQIAETAKFACPAVRRALRRLEAAGWFKRRGGKRGSVTQFTLIPERFPVSTSTKGGCASIGYVSGIVVRQTLHDAFRRGALPRSSALVLAALDPLEPKTAKEINAATGQSSSTIYLAFKKLAAVGLATKDGAYAWVRCAFPELLLDDIAAKLGTEGGTARQHRRHADERTAYGEEFGCVERVVNRETGEFRIVAKLGHYSGGGRPVGHATSNTTGRVSLPTTTTTRPTTRALVESHEAQFEDSNPSPTYAKNESVDEPHMTAELRRAWLCTARG